MLWKYLLSINVLRAERDTPLNHTWVELTQRAFEMLDTTDTNLQTHVYSTSLASSSMSLGEGKRRGRVRKPSLSLAVKGHLQLRIRQTCGYIWRQMAGFLVLNHYLRSPCGEVLYEWLNNVLQVALLVQLNKVICPGFIVLKNTDFPLS